MTDVTTGDETDRRRASVTALRQRLIEQRLSGHSVRTPMVGPDDLVAARPEVLPLSYAQQRLWLLEQLRPGGVEYLVPLALRLTGESDESALRGALHRIVTRHEVLRTRYVADDGVPRQIVDDEPRFEWLTVDLRDLPVAAGRQRWRELRAAAGARPFDLAVEQPLRAQLVHFADDRPILLLTIHHIGFDGWSAGVLVGELASLYREATSGQAADLPALGMQYADFALRQRGPAPQPVVDDELQFWRTELAGLTPLRLPTDRSHPEQWQADGDLVSFTVPAATAKRFLAIGKAAGATPFMTVLAGVSALLARWTGQPDVAVGTPVANRTTAGTEPLVGFFANTLVLRADLADDPPFTELVEQVRRRSLQAYAHQDVPYETLVSDQRPTRDLSRDPLLQVVLDVTDVDAGAGQPTGEFEEVPIDWFPAKFELALSVRQADSGELQGGIIFATALFDSATVRRLADRLVRLMGAVAERPDRRLSRLDLRTPAEMAADKRREVPAASAAAHCVPELVARWAVETPTAIAVSADGATLSYRELDERAHRLAHRLRERGVDRGDIVAVFMHRGAELVVALLAVWKAGAGYLPLDPDQPPDRLAFMTGDAAVAVVLTERLLAAVTTGWDRPVLVADDDDERDRVARCPATEPDRHVGADDLAYVIYTSGSTGKPKGVAVTHGNAARLFSVTETDFGFGPTDVWTFFHSCAFDFSVWEIWGALAHGGRLVVVPFGVSRSPQDFLHLLAEERVTVLNQTPTAFANLISALPDKGPELALKWVMFGGEALDPDALTSWFDRFGDDRPRLINMYGITETTVHVTYRRITAADTGRAGSPRRSPIGRPIADLGLYLLDGAFAPAPFGLPGELYVGGAGVAMGYLNRPALTAERFVPDPYSSQPGARMYRSGDLGRRVRADDVVFLGRVDHQVKIRGFRIETEEIQAALGAHPDVEASLVVVHNFGPQDRQLVGYVVPVAARMVDAYDLRSRLARTLPRYMIPAAFVMLESLPLTVNGKIDIRALPEPQRKRLDSAVEFTPPRSPVQAAAAQIWAEALGVPHVGIRDNFFELGGDSIRAVQVVGQLRAAGHDITVLDLFRNQTIEQLLRDGARPSAPDAPRVAPFALLVESDRATVAAGLDDAYPLAAGQTGMLYEQLADDRRRLYHNVTCYMIRDPEPFDLAALRAAAQAVVARHEVLRTSFDLVTYSEPLQLVHRECRVEVRYSDLRGVPDADRDRTVRAAIAAERDDVFELTAAPLWRLVVHEQDDGWRLSFVECHAILDGWSHNSLITELLATYQDLRDRLPAAAPAEAAGVRFVDFVALERDTSADPEVRRFWRERLTGVDVLRLPGHWAGSGPDDQRNYEIRVPFGHLNDGLRRLAKAAGAPLKSVLLTAHLKALSMVTDQVGFASGLASNGRLETLGGDRVAGMHLNIVPIRSPRFEGPWREVVRAVFEEEVEIWPNRRYPLVSLQQDQTIDPAYASIGFNYLDFHVLNREKVDLSRSVDDSPNEFTFGVSTEPGHLVLTCDGEQIGYAFGQALAGVYATVLAAMADDPDSDSASVRPPLPDGDGVPAPPVDPALTLYEIVGRWAERTPEAVALRCGDRTVSYAQLMVEVDRLARRLRQAGVEPRSVVGLQLPSSVELVLSMLAVARVGAAFLTLSDEQPLARRQLLLSGASVTVVVTEDQSRAELTAAGYRCVTPRDEPPAGTGGPAAWPVTDPADAAYVIFTSGSTGAPKGVVVEHRSLANMVAATAAILDIGPGDRMLQSMSPIFDAAVFEIVMTLGTGATLVVASREELIPGEPLIDLIRAQAVTHLAAIPSTLALLPTDGYTPRVISTGGEELPAALAAQWAGRCTLINAYGPAECTIGTTFGLINPDGGRPTIGRPIAGAQAHVLGPDLLPRPVGVPGELYIGGAGVGRGYLGRPGLTADRFVPDPFSSRPGARLYRTGDRVSLDPDGELAFHGRLDQQVKIRGQRIELGEIEAALYDCDGVRQAAVIVDTPADGERRLAAYLVTEDGANLPLDRLVEELRERLPGYMVPMSFTFVPHLPVTAGGKLDRAALPAPARRQVLTTQPYVAARNATEEQIAGVWAEVLGLERIGVHDDFFLSGGHSLLAMRAVALLKRRLGLPVSVAALLRRRTVAALASALSDGDDGGTADEAGQQSLIWLRTDGDQPPLVCVHPGGGSVHWYRTLAERLPPGMPVVALQHPGIVDPDSAGDSIEDLATAYLTALSAVQPRGPYRVLGWCGGAPIAWEIARRLTGTGAQFELVLLDPASDVATEDGSDIVHLLGRCEQLLIRLGEGPDEAEATAIRAEAAPILLRAVNDNGGIAITPETVGPEWLGRVRTWYRMASATLEYRYPAAEIAVHLVLGDDLVEQSHEAARGLTLPAYLERWATLATRGLRTHRTPGGHLQVLEEPHVDHLAALLTGIMRLP